MNIYLCSPEESLNEALDNIMKNDPDGRKFTLDEDRDRCYIGDEVFSTAPVIINKHNQYYAPKEI
ncbi:MULTISPECIES: hypothetical protein [unclassified Butyrivibrio]|uniref:hypothetical protein n=1 Tax=unclassified Butyrivibrio TaxID=2639466 RepID=UPI000425F785|nr:MULTISPECIES: hypothetical protein [unclassified Butyrivibrio]